MHCFIHWSTVPKKETQRKRGEKKKSQFANNSCEYLIENSHCGWHLANEDGDLWIAVISQKFGKEKRVEFFWVRGGYRAGPLG